MKLSIITINRNNADGLCRTLESTLGGQTGFDDWEQIVVDGASTDGSFSSLHKWKNDPRLGWHVSEPDKGIYNAMNKGAEHARGDYLLFLNSGDELVVNVLPEVFSKSFDADIVYGDLKIICNDDSVGDKMFPEPEEISVAWFLFEYLPHPASFISREYFLKVGGYDETYKIIGDAKFFIEAVAGNLARLKHLSFPISRFDGTGLSSNAVFREKLLAEKERLFTEKFGRLTALRVLSPPEGRSWMLPDVAHAAKKDPQLAHFLLCTTAVIARAWRFAFLRDVLHGIDVVLSRLHIARKTKAD